MLVGVRCLRRCGDHPREYGENDVIRKGAFADTGSSPRIRGKFALQVKHGCAKGIIPANTGKITSGSGAANGAGDHPREYGENPISGNELDIG